MYVPMAVECDLLARSGEFPDCLFAKAWEYFRRRSINTTLLSYAKIEQMRLWSGQIGCWKGQD